MRKLLLMGCLFMILASSCEKEEVEVNALPVGLWKITKFTDDGADETSDFANYTFDFQADGKLIVQTPTKTYTGVWNDNMNAEKMEFKITGTQQLDTLKDDWLIIKSTNVTLWLKDDDSEGEEVIFTKL